MFSYVRAKSPWFKYFTGIAPDEKGSIRIFKHREIEGKIKTCTIKKDGTGAWYAIFVTEQDDPAKIERETAIGVDLGISHAVVTSDDQCFDYPRYYVQAQKQNRAAEKSLHTY